MGEFCLQAWAEPLYPGRELKILDAILHAAPTVLVVEDEGLVRHVIAEYLREAGYTVVETGTGEAALDALEHEDEQPIDIVFTDIRLGGTLNGWDVAEAFRAKHPELPIIYTSGYAVSPPREVGGSLYFNKPYDPQDILRACRGFETALA